MKSMLREVEHLDEHYQCLAFICPGCKSMKDNGTGLHLLPVNCKNHGPSWDFDGNLEAPTLSPSIRTSWSGVDKDGQPLILVCHSFLKDGIFQFLDDCTHELAGQLISIPDLPNWVYKETIRE